MLLFNKYWCKRSFHTRIEYIFSQFFNASKHDNIENICAVITIEYFLKFLGGVAGIACLVFAIYQILRAQERPSGLETGSSKIILRTSYLAVASLFFIALAVVIWKPLPVHLSSIAEFIILLLGAVLYFPSLLLYLWGMHTLGSNFNASSGFGVRLQQDHKLVTSGPFAYIRHPMYLGVILACWGGLLMYLTWTMLVYAIMMFGLIYRAHKEEAALFIEFGDTWEAYRQRVPGWVPRI
ncbi:MAG: isoprenylcysteine carboxylmethyltransferase family protein [Anaerolineae bacterium]|nr:isoprenylcysteine carboxylmethyltransferase family protein [Anaerolineae bacterium]